MKNAGKLEALFKANKTYFYALDWYQDGGFLYNVSPRGVLRVENKI